MKILGEINSNNQNFIITSPFFSPSLNSVFNSNNCLSRLWQVSSRNSETVINVGDVIKLGRVRLKVDKIQLNENNTNSYNINVTNLQSSYNTLNAMSEMRHINSKGNLDNCGGNTITNINNSINVEEDKDSKANKKGNDQKCCRICYSPESDINDPLISPCKCSGSMRLIHYKCMKLCIDSKVTKKEDEFCKMITWKGFECEICKEEYPKYLKNRDKLYPLVDLEPSFNEYMLCDYCLYDDTKKKTFRKGVLLINLSKKNEITIGRTQSNLIKLKDISVSRMHCSIIRKQNNLYIIDKGSKFGTMKYVNKEVVMNEKVDTLKLVSGKYFLDVNFLNQKSFWNFFEIKFFNFECCHSKNTNDKDFLIDEEEGEKSAVEPNNYLTTNNNINKVELGKIIDRSYEDIILDIENFVKEECD